jgi:CRISPR/Cas system CMR subunit Cmr6 (Cas7 group RAMP superfamily)
MIGFSMQSTSFDSHALVKVLIAEGLNEPVAEAIINAIKVSRDNDFSRLVSKEQVSLLEKDIETLRDNVASKTDLIEVRNELKNEINEVRNELKNEINEVRKDIELIRKEVVIKADKIDIERTKIQLIMWVGSFFVASTSIILGFLKYFAH